MKICLVAPVSHWRGGIHQYSVHLVNHLANKVNVEVISYKNIFPRWLYPGAIPKTPAEITLSAAVDVHEILKYYSVLSAFRAALIISRRIRPDVVDIQWFVPQHGFVLIPLILFLKYCFRSTVRIVLTVHNVQPHENRMFDRWLSRTVFRLSDRLLVHAEKLRSEMVEQFGERPGKIVVIPHAICAAEESRYGKAEARERLGIKEKHVLLFFGYVRRYKGLNDLIKAFSMIRENSDVALVIAGEFFTSLDFYREQLQDGTVNGRIHLFPRYIGSDEVSVFFTAADVLIQPYVKFSGQSGVTQTAYLHSLPVIATNVGGLPELVIHKKTGIIVSPAKPADLAIAIETLLSDERRRRCYGANGKKLLDTNLGWDRVTEMMLKTYAET
jgi:glycosyltransferase involved in cell wall biosynthesis